MTNLEANVNVNDTPPVTAPVQNPARLPHGTTQDQINEMESEGQATTQGQSPSPPPAEPSTTRPFMLTLRRRETVVAQTEAFHFDKPSGFQFAAGQTLDLTLLNPGETDAEGNTRTFSIASSPEDADLVIATRLRNTAFKRVLAAMPIDSVLEAVGPGGSFMLDTDAGRPVVFLTGGIGITPFRSMIRDETARKLTRPVWLFYSNTTPEAAAFLDELRQLADAMPFFHFVPTMTDMATSAREWHGATGFINREMLSSRLPIIGPQYYIAGPPAMVTAMQQMLEDAGVSDGDVHAEEFAGY